METTHTLSDDLMAEIREAFYKSDRKKTGYIRRHKFGTVMRALGFNHTESELYRYIQELDEEETGIIQFDEFVALATKLYQVVHQKEFLLAAFKVFDRDGEGIITQAKLRTMFNNLGEKISDDEFDCMFQEVDIDKDGVINLKDFLEAYNH